MTPEARRFAERMKAKRITLYWSLHDLSRHAGVHNRYLGRLERGVQVPSLDVAAKIARALKVKLGELTDVS
jgi:transcriptional regulator with XRE-family HTH domain